MIFTAAFVCCALLAAMSTARSWGRRTHEPRMLKRLPYVRTTEYGTVTQCWTPEERHAHAALQAALANQRRSP